MQVPKKIIAAAISLTITISGLSTATNAGQLSSFAEAASAAAAGLGKKYKKTPRGKESNSRGFTKQVKRATEKANKNIRRGKKPNKGNLAKKAGRLAEKAKNSIRRGKK